jgi:threonine/homoserine efflux transporter RhtA
MKKWHVVLTVVVALLGIAIYFFLTSSNIYSAQAVAVEAGGPIGMAPFTDRIDFGDIPQGQGVTKTVVLENTGDNDNSIKIWVMGSIGQMIDVKPGKSFELKAGSTQDVDFIFNMPVSTPVGKKFTGRIIILKLP